MILLALEIFKTPRSHDDYFQIEGTFCKCRLHALVVFWRGWFFWDRASLPSKSPLPLKCWVKGMWHHHPALVFFYKGVTYIGISVSLKPLFLSATSSEHWCTWLAFQTAWISSQEAGHAGFGISVPLHHCCFIWFLICRNS